MSLAEQSLLRVILYEGQGADPIPAAERLDLLTRLLADGYAVSRVAPGGTVAPADRATLLVLGRFPGGEPPATFTREADVAIHFQNLDGHAVDDVAESVQSIRDQHVTARHGEWKPWFPVIDYDRCTNCMQCLSFCLFDVYGVDGEQKIQVQNNDNCKTNCPACSRVCPEAAIMFPKYKSGPINGDIVSDQDLQREKMKVDISALLGGDVYQLLRDRSERAKSRFSKERDSDKALNERQKCLTKLATAGDIPPEVLASLPSPEEIQRRAGQAASKAQAALNAQPSAD